MTIETNPCPVCRGIYPEHPEFERADCCEECITDLDKACLADQRRRVIAWSVECVETHLALGARYAREGRWEALASCLSEAQARAATIREIEAADTMRLPSVKEVA